MSLVVSAISSISAAVQARTSSIVDIVSIGGFLLSRASPVWADWVAAPSGKNLIFAVAFVQAVADHGLPKSE
jgi:hypothetical protein